VHTAKIGNEMAICCQTSSRSHHARMRGGVPGVWPMLAIVVLAACDPLQGSGTGTPPDPSKYIKVDAASHSAIVTLIAGYPATDFQFNYDGYGNGALVLVVPAGWEVTIQCVNHGTVPNSCAVVADGKATEPVQPSWSTADPHRGLDPGQSASFVFTPTAQGTYRIASLVDGSEASGMWADLVVGGGGVPTLTAH